MSNNDSFIMITGNFDYDHRFNTEGMDANQSRHESGSNNSCHILSLSSVTPTPIGSTPTASF